MSILNKIINIFKKTFIGFLRDDRPQCKAKIYYVDQTYHCTKKKGHWGPHISYKGRPFCLDSGVLNYEASI